MKKNLFPIALSFLLCQTVFAQQSDSLLIRFAPSWFGQGISLPYTGYDSSIPDSTTLEVFRCYVAHFELWNEEDLVWKEDNSFHLLDAEIESTLGFQLRIPQHLNYTSIKFQLGIDSLTSVSGAMVGDLDPTKGMFWTWNTGYIHFKLEGRHPICKTRKNRFQFHLGGYAGPYATIQDIALPVSEKRNLDIAIRLDQFVQPLDLENQNSIMIPGPEAFALSKIAQQIFQLKDEE